MSSNLLSNAVKYSPDAPLIKVSAVVRDGSAAIKVEDSGLGILLADVSGIVGAGAYSGLTFNGSFIQPDEDKNATPTTGPEAEALRHNLASVVGGK